MSAPPRILYLHTTHGIFDVHMEQVRCACLVAVQYETYFAAIDSRRRQASIQRRCSGRCQAGCQHVVVSQCELRRSGSLLVGTGYEYKRGCRTCRCSV